MFKVTTNGSSDIKTIVSAIATLAEEATFTANADGMKFRTMDPSHTALIDMELPKEAFESYECDSDLQFGVRISDLSKIIKRSKRDENVTITINTMNNLLINIGDDKEFEMRLIEPESTQTPVPNIIFDTKITLPLQKISGALTDIGIFSEYLTITVTTNSVVFSGKGDSGKVSVKANEITEPIIGSAVVTHELKDLVSVIGSFVEKDMNCTIELSSSKPAKYVFKIAGVGIINFFMAPRVES
jgi:proliferating cell nuclear antigen